MICLVLGAIGMVPTVVSGLVLVGVNISPSNKVYTCTPQTETCSNTPQLTCHL